LEALNARWQPHAVQQKILYSIFVLGVPLCFLELGRKAGKTEIICYFLWRRALLNPGGHYYFAPEQKQAKEIIWASRRLQDFGPGEFIASVNNTEMRITLTNGSFIKVDGSDNFNSYRGIEPHSAVYDEKRDFRPEFHQVMGPNLAVHKAQLLACSTPPEQAELEHYDGLKAGLVPDESYFNYPTWVNPYIDKAWLKKERARLYAIGEADVWEREYGAKRVRGGRLSIFPMFDRATHVRPHVELADLVAKDRRKLDWLKIADPGTASVFAILFFAFNRYSRTLYVLDEIYETSQMETSTSRIVPRAKQMAHALYEDALEDAWDCVYDEAEAWFAQEAMNSFGEHWRPTHKAKMDKGRGLSIIKDLMLHGRIVFSDRCKGTIKEVENYLKKPDGTIPKGNDHGVDLLRYAAQATGLDLVSVPEPEVKDPDTMRRAYSLEEDERSERDAFDQMFDDL
jgi:hypothetical protein